MNKMELIKASITTSTAGVYSGKIPVPHGRLLQYRCKLTALSTKGHVTLKGSTTGLTYLNLAINASTAATTRAPRQPLSDSSGNAIYFTTDTSTPQRDFYYVGGEMLTLSVSSGGTSKTGTIWMWVG
jgi:hypothetical protein